MVTAAAAPPPPPKRIHYKPLRDEFTAKVKKYRFLLGCVMKLEKCEPHELFHSACTPALIICLSIKVDGLLFFWGAAKMNNRTSKSTAANNWHELF